MHTQEQRLDFLLKYLLSEKGQEQPCGDFDEKCRLLRALVNVRQPLPVSEGFLQIQNEFLQQQSLQRGIVESEELPSAAQRFGNHVPYGEKLVLWRGDITTLRADAIVNAANAAMLGCFAPQHNCIDNVIHTAAGVQLRQACQDSMQRNEAATGSAHVTPGFNLPARFVIHTVGPIVDGPLREEHRSLLALCYKNCLTAAEEKACRTLAFCCISTGVYCFPPQEAARIALNMVSSFMATGPLHVNRVIFNVFSEKDESIYAELFTGGHHASC